MHARAVFLIAAACAACSTDPVLPAMPATPAMPAPLAVASWTEATDAAFELERELREEIARSQREHPGKVPDAFVEPTPALVAAFGSVRIFEMHAGPSTCGGTSIAVGGGALVTALTLAYNFESVWSRPRVFVRREPGGMRVHEQIPRDVWERTRVTRTAGAVWISLDRAWSRRELELTVVSDDAMALLWVPPLQAGPDPGWAGRCGAVARLTSLSVDGRPAEFMTYGDLLVVKLAQAGRPVQLRLVIDEPVLDDPLGVLIQWAPAALHIPHEIDLRVYHDQVVSHELVVGAVTTPITAPPGWRGEHVLMRGLAPSLFVQSRPPAVDASSFVAGGRTIHVHPSARNFELRDCAEQLQAVAARLPALGPVADLHLAVARFDAGNISRHDGRLVLMNAIHFAALCDPDVGDDGEHEFLHELAHAWFGGNTAPHDDEAAAVWESLAEMVALMAGPEPAAAARRRGHLAEYQRVDHDIGIMQRVQRSSAVRHVLSYSKGPLALQALSDQLGAERFQEVLRTYVRLAADVPGSWRTLLAAVEQVAGADEASWARAWLITPGAPTLGFGPTRVASGRLHTSVTQAADTAFQGTVEIVQVSPGGTTRHRVAFGPGETAVDLPLLPGAASAQLDPDARLPRRVPEGQPLVPEVDLGATASRTR